MFLKKAAEVSGIQTGNPGNLVDGNRTVIILVRVVQDKVQTVQIFYAVNGVCLIPWHVDVTRRAARVC